MIRLRALRVVVAGTATVVVAMLGYVLARIGRGRYLEHLCTTRAPAGAWAPPELTVVRGPVPDGLVDFRCEAAAAPQYHFSFTDPLPLLGSCAVAAVVAAVALLVWAWALGATSRREPLAPPA